MVLNTVNDIYHSLLYILETERYGNANIDLMKRDIFSNLTNADRVKVTTDLLRQYGLLPDVKLLKNKSLEKSLELRSAGNKAFMRKDDKGALLLYTKSIAEVPFPKNSDLLKDENAGDALAITFANRSAVLFSIGKYELCLRDISQAFKYSYPDKLLHKLYERQGKCLQYLGKKKEAVESISNALKWLPSATELSQDKKETIEEKLQKLLKCIQNANANVKLPSYKLPKVPTCSYNKNSEIPCASDCVQLKYSPEMGRYISATRDIKPGDVLVVEKPFASLLNTENCETHCYNCLQRCEALLPCCFCPNVMYCSEECRSLSWNGSHFIDCSLLPTLEKLQIISVNFLALKTVIKACKNKNLKDMLVSLEAEGNLEQRKRGFNDKGQYISSDYSPIYWLVAHTEKRTLENLLAKSVIAACILHCLETMTDFFSDVDINQFKYEIGGLLLRHVQNLGCNVHEVYEFHITDNAKSVEEQMEKIVGIGTGIYGTSSLFNHSCAPNMSRAYHRGDTAVLYALCPIAAGEQIFESYGHEYAKAEKGKRRSYFESNYYFTCRCIACMEDWPIIYFLTLTDPNFICNRCKQVLPTRVSEAFVNTTTCAICNKTHNLVETSMIILLSGIDFIHNKQQLLEREDGIDWNEVVQKLIPHLVLLHENIKQPFLDHMICQEVLKLCFARTGNFYKL